MSRALLRVGSRPLFGLNDTLVTLQAEQNMPHAWYALLLVVKMDGTNPLIQFS